MGEAFDDGPGVIPAEILDQDDLVTIRERDERVRQAAIQLGQDRRGPIDGDDRGDLQRGARRGRQAERAAVIRADVEIEGSIRHAADSISPVHRVTNPKVALA